MLSVLTTIKKNVSWNFFISVMPLWKLTTLENKLSWQFSGEPPLWRQLTRLENIWMMHQTAIHHKIQYKDSPLKPDTSEIRTQISRNMEMSAGYIYRPNFLRNHFLWCGWVQGFFSSQLGHRFLSPEPVHIFGTETNRKPRTRLSPFSHHLHWWEENLNCATLHWNPSLPL